MEPSVRRQAVALARHAVVACVQTRAFSKVPAELAPALLRPGAAFVTLRREALLRGCIGTFQPRHPTLADEIVSAAVGAAASDPRFAPIAPWELPFLAYKVALLSPIRRVYDLTALDPAEHGLVLREPASGRSAVLLPRVPGVTTVAEQVAALYEKAGVTSAVPVEFWAFTAEDCE